MSIISSGNLRSYSTDPNDWIFVDIGFAGSGKKSTGLLMPGDTTATNLTWADACEKIRKRIEVRRTPINVMIEAPLSISFDSNGNPVGRTFEKKGLKARYWYLQGGAVVMFASMLLLQRIAESNGPIVRLFEAFVSFKLEKTDHAADACLMRDWLLGSVDAETFEPEKFDQGTKINTTSSTAKFGIDFGVPPVVMLTHHPD